MNWHGNLLVCAIILEVALSVCLLHDNSSVSIRCTSSKMPRKARLHNINVTKKNDIISVYRYITRENDKLRVNNKSDWQLKKQTADMLNVATTTVHNVLSGNCYIILFSFNNVHSKTSHKNILA